ncbi:Oidioi.mRNA.OKI2018_I69.chr1.g3619.t1.cds [Oikopleura dioica]|uniref:non-specific serine/threonine protein kinase n=1 Tax=Oikopleura dioica TaxID=34765 RepID=A0ABN7T1H9_OIKDI|nr:Oidioi.mRNA.OKI2018_I69.chr1.g3619.t1.cds [Oikopleura dioica]
MGFQTPVFTSEFSQKYKKIKELGKGAFGKAVLAQRKHDNLQCVIKLIKTKNDQDVQLAREEAKILKSLSHQFIVRYIDEYESKNAGWGGTTKEVRIVMEFCDGGDLQNAIESTRVQGRRFKEEDIFVWFSQIVMAIEYIHGMKIAHRDIKPLNIFFMRGLKTCKLGDFGIVRCFNDDVQSTFSGVGTPLYFPPEICMGERYGVDCDIWSLGVLLYEMIMLKSPFMDPNMMQIYYKIKNRIYQPIQGSPHAAQIIQSCFKDRQKENMMPNQSHLHFRPTASDLLNHPVVFPIYEQLRQGISPERVTVTMQPAPGTYRQPGEPGNTGPAPNRPPLERRPSEIERARAIRQKLLTIERDLTRLQNRKAAHKTDGARIDEDQVQYQKLKKERQQEVEFANRIITQMNEESRIINRAINEGLVATQAFGPTTTVKLGPSDYTRFCDFQKRRQLIIEVNRQRVDLTNRINNWNDEGREIKKNIEVLEKQQLELTQELYSIHPSEVNDLNEQLSNLTESMKTIRQDKNRAGPKDLQNTYYKTVFEPNSQFQNMTEQDIRQTMDTSCDVHLLRDLHLELEKRLGINQNQPQRGERYMKFVDNRIREQLDVVNGSVKKMFANYMGDNVAYQTPEMLPRDAVQITEAHYLSISYS